MKKLSNFQKNQWGLFQQLQPFISVGLNINNKWFSSDVCNVYTVTKMNFIPLVDKPYVNEVPLNEQNMYWKSFFFSELKLCILRRSRSFQRSTVGLRWSTGIKVIRSQSWRLKKKSATRPSLNLMHLRWVKWQHFFFKSQTLTACNFNASWPKKIHSTS